MTRDKVFQIPCCCDFEHLDSEWFDALHMRILKIRRSQAIGGQHSKSGKEFTPFLYATVK